MAFSLCKLVWFSIKVASSCLKIKNCNDCEIQSPTICDIADTSTLRSPESLAFFARLMSKPVSFLLTSTVVYLLQNIAYDEFFSHVYLNERKANISFKTWMEYTKTSLVKGFFEFTCQKTRVTQKRSKTRREEITRLLKIDIYICLSLINVHRRWLPWEKCRRHSWKHHHKIVVM